jgi:hypothetical protein
MGVDMKVKPILKKIFEMVTFDNKIEESPKEKSKWYWG